jgi:heme A synthase
MLGRITVALFFVLLVWGNLVAGLKAGLACPDWPLCHGRVLPPLRVDVWMEFMHRVIAAAASVSLVLLSWRRFRDYTGTAKAVPLAAVGLIALQIILGGVVVLLELPVQLTTLHFMIGLVVFLLAFYMMVFDRTGETPLFSLRRYSGLFFFMGLFVFSQAALGAYVRHSEAGQACPDFPMCMGSWFPPFADWQVMVHLSHRFTGALILLTFMALYAATFVDPRMARHRSNSFILLVLCLVQIGVGAMVVLSGLRFEATAFHLAVALGMLSLLFHMWASEVREPEELRRVTG